MGVLSKEDVSALKRKESWFTVRLIEELRFWNRHRPWDINLFRRNNLSPVSVAVKTTESISDTTKTRYNSRSPLRLPCGVVIDRGYSGTTAQSRVVYLQNIRVDSVQEINDAMEDLSRIFHMDMWEVKRLELHNLKHGPIINFSVFNPDGTGASLYLETVEDSNSKRIYFDVSPFEQQKLCNNIQEKIANCTFVTRLVPKCGIMEHYKQKAREAKLPN